MGIEQSLAHFLAQIAHRHKIVLSLRSHHCHTPSDRTNTLAKHIGRYGPISNPVMFARSGALHFRTAAAFDHPLFVRSKKLAVAPFQVVAPSARQQKPPHSTTPCP